MSITSLNRERPEEQALLHPQSPLLQATSSQFDEEEGLDLREYWHIANKHKWSILGLTLVISLLVTLVVFSMQPIYKATATMLVESKAAKVVSIEEIYGIGGNSKYLSTQFEILRSRELAEQVADKVNASGYKTPVEKNSRFALNWRSWLPEALSGEKVKAANSGEKGNKPVISAAMIMNGLSVQPLKQSQLVNLSFESPDPRLAALVPNILAEAYVESDLEARLQMTQKASSWLTERLGGLRTKLEESERKLQAFRDKEKLVDVEGVRTVAASQLGSISERLIEARQKRTEAENIYKQVRALKGSSASEMESIPAVLQHSLIQGLKQAELEAARKVAELGKRYGPRHPKMIAAQSELNSARTNLREQIIKVVAGIEKEYQVARDNERSVQGQYNQVKKEVQGINRKEYELGVLERDVATNRELYDMFLTRFKETDTTSGFESAIARIIDPAVVPAHPYKPDKQKIIAVSVLMSLMLGVMLTVVLEKLDRTFKGTEDVEDKLGIPVLGALPFLEIKSKDDKKSQRMFIDEPRSVFSEAIRTMRTGVMLSSLDEPHKVVVVTSSVPGEGKSTVAMNLAIALGHMEKVLVIDGDMRRPTVAKSLGLKPSSPGLSNLVAGTANLSECIHKIDGSTVEIMPSGIVPPNPLELLSSKRFAAAIEKLSEHYDRVVIDSAPIHSVSDSMLLSKYASALIYVVRADSTPYQVAQQGVKRLRQVGAPLIGVAMNMVETKKSGYYGYGRYGYYGGYQYSEES